MKLPVDPTAIPSHVGHRARLRERFLRSGFEGMLDYEVMELLLTILIPQRDVKPLAKRLLAEFGWVSKVLDAPPEQLRQIPGLGEVSVANLKIIRALHTYYLGQKCAEAGELLTRPELVANFARTKLGARQRESYMVLFLDAGNRLIDFEEIAEGTIDRVFLYARNAAEAALRRHSVNVIMVHNHPTGDCRPSPDDLEATRALAWALASIQVKLCDHLIVSRESCFSFAAHNMLRPAAGGQETQI